MADWYWHIHHEIICEPLTEPLQHRLDYIRGQKPQHEVETRLRLIAPVTVELPAELVKAGEAYDKAWEAYDKAQAAFDKAGEAVDKARAAYVKALAHDKAWAAHDKARAAVVKAQSAFEKAGEAYDKAWEAYVKALAASELEALHALDCPAALAGTCPWDGKTIFPVGDDV